MEVDLEGNIVWQYMLSDHLKTFTNPGFDVELLPNNNILIVAVVWRSPKIFEVTPNGDIVWQLAVRGKYL